MQHLVRVPHERRAAEVANAWRPLNGWINGSQQSWIKVLATFSGLSKLLGRYAILTPMEEPWMKIRYGLVFVMAIGLGLVGCASGGGGDVGGDCG